MAELTTGERIKRIRTRTGMTRTVLGGLVGRSVEVLIEGTGAYTATYASVAFNGFAPLRTYHI